MIQVECAFYTFLKIACCCLLIVISSYLPAQMLQFPAVYPALPFNLEKAKKLGYNKCTVWKGKNSKTAGDESGTIWSSILQESHQFQKYVFPEGILDIVSRYASSGDKIWSMEYFYKQGLLSAIEQLTYDSLQDASVEYAYAYLYSYDSIPFQRVKMFGFPNQKLRLLEEFEFDTQRRLVRCKSTVSGLGPHMDSLVGLLSGEQLLSLHEYDSQYIANRRYKNLYVILKDEKSYLNDQGQIFKTVYRNAKGRRITFVEYFYEDTVLSSKRHWKFPLPDVSEPIPISNKKRKKNATRFKKNNTSIASDSSSTSKIPAFPTLFKTEVFTFSLEGLIETHLIEENGIQTVLEYTYFME
jgi:hypothetical protein